MRPFAFISSLLAVALFAVPAFAAEAVQQQWWQALIANLLEVIIAIFVPVLSTLFVVLARRWKINLEFDQVNSIAVKAAGWAEQKAASALKEGKPQTPSAEKLQWALDFAKEMTDKYKLPTKATEKLQDLIEAGLGEKKVAEPVKTEATS